MNEFTTIHRMSYDLVAEAFAETNKAIPEAVRLSAERFIDLLPQNALILDAGCGHGRETAWFTAKGYRTVAYDLSAGMLQQAGKFVRQNRIQGDMQQLPFQDAVFHAVWCNAALLHIPKALAHTCLRGFYRVLMKEGVLYLAVQSGEGEMWETHGYGLDVPRFFARYSFKEGAALLESARFRMIEQTQYNRGSGAHWLHYLGCKNAD